MISLITISLRSVTALAPFGVTDDGRSQAPVPSGKRARGVDFTSNESSTVRPSAAKNTMRLPAGDAIGTVRKPPAGIDVEGSGTAVVPLTPTTLSAHPVRLA